MTAVWHTPTTYANA